MSEPRTTLHRAVDGVTHTLNPEAILAAARARKRSRVALAGMGAAAAVAAVGLALTVLPGGETGADGDLNVAEPRPYGDWVPVARRLGTPAPVGSYMYLEGCAAGNCQAFLHPASGDPFALEAVSAQAARLVEADPANATLSYDGRWVGANSTEGGYRLINLETGASIAVEPTSQDTLLTPLGWTAQSTGFTVYQRAADGSLMFTHVDTIPTVRVSEPATLTTSGLEPAVFGGSGIVFLTTPDDPGRRRTAPSEQGDQNLVVAADGYESGELLVVPPGDSLSACMRDDESLNGPQGLPVMSTPPLLEERLSSVPMSTYVVFDLTGEPSAVISKQCNSSDVVPTGRYEIPAGHELLGALPNGMSALRSPDNKVVAVGPSGDPVVIGSIPADSTTILPGSPTLPIETP